jgi:hypothetical protein
VTTVTIGSGTVTKSFYYGDTSAGGPTVTAAIAGLASAHQVETINPGTAASLLLAAASTTPAAGAADNLTITARDSFGNTATGYVGDKSLTFGGPSTIGTTHPTVTSKTGAAVNVGTATTITFTSGVASVSGSSNGVITFYKAESVNVTVTDGSNTNGTGLPVTVGPGSATVAVSSGSGQSAAVAAGFTSPLVASVSDTWGNSISGASVTFSGPASGAGVTFANCTSNPQTYSCVATSNAGGQATSSAFFANRTAGSYTITASVAGGSSVGFSETNTDTLHVSALAETGGAVSGGLYGATVTVTVHDALGAAINGVTITGTWSPTAAGATSGCTTNASGICTIASGSFFHSGQPETWDVSNLALTGYTYNSAADNDGGSITAQQSGTCTTGTVCATVVGTLVDTSSTKTPTVTLGPSVATPAGSIVEIVIFRDSSSSDAIDTTKGTNGWSGTGFTTTPILVNQQTFSSGYYEWVYRTVGSGVAGGTIGLNFKKSNTASVVDVVVLSGTTNAPNAAVVQSNPSANTGTTAPVTLGSAPAAGNGELAVLGAPVDEGTSGVAAPTNWSRFDYNHGSGYSEMAYVTGTAATSTSFTLPTSANWGAVALELAAASAQVAPAVTAVSPAGGGTAGGTTVTVTGTNLTGASAVYFGTAAGTSISVNGAGTSLTVTAPAGTPGTVDVTVQTPDGLSTTSSSDQFTYDATPTVTSVSPSTGSTVGGTSVTVTGTGFLSATAVKFGSTPGTGLSITSDTSLTVTSPAGSAGTVDVTVVNPTGTSATGVADSFTYSAGAPAGLYFAGIVQSSGTSTCAAPPVSTAIACTASSMGASGTFTANVEFVNAGGTPVSNTSGGSITINCAQTTITSPGGTVLPASSTIAPGATATASTFQLKGGGSGWKGTMTCTATVSGTTYSIAVTGS